MTNAVLQQMITTYGDRIYAFGLDNGSVLYIGYKNMNSPLITDIVLETIGTIDFFKVPRTINTTGIDINVTNFTETSKIQWVGTMDVGYEKYRVDPLILR